MSRKPNAPLDGLVAVKGRAAPALDEPTVAAPEPAPAPPRKGSEGSAPLNFKVDDTFRREFKAYAAAQGLSMVDLLRLCYAAYRKQGG